MRKQLFCLLTCGISLLNGLFFFLGSLALLVRGIPDVDNQGALLFIPLLWITAAAVLLFLNGCTLACGFVLEKGYRFHPGRLFCLRGLRGGKLVCRAGLLLLSALVLLHAFCVSAPNGHLLDAAYLLTGVLYLLCLYLWRQAEAGRHAG